jgi:hypothetical protein
MTDVRILVPPQQLAALLPAFQGWESVYTVSQGDKGGLSRCQLACSLCDWNASV